MSPWFLFWLVALTLTLRVALGFEIDRRRDAAEARAKAGPKPEEKPPS